MFHHELNLYPSFSCIDLSEIPILALSRKSIQFSLLSMDKYKENLQSTKASFFG